jgi:hypothetical protein
MPRTIGLQIRLTEEERGQITEAAHKDGRTASDWARRTILNAVAGIHVGPIREWPELPKELLGPNNKDTVFAALESTAMGAGDRGKPKPANWDSMKTSERSTWMRQNR